MKEHNNLNSLLQRNIDIIQGQLNNPSDLIVRKMIVGDSSSINTALLYIDGIVNMQVVQDSIIEPLLTMKNIKQPHHKVEEVAYHHIKSGDVKISDLIEPLIEGLLKGKTIILFDNCTKGILTDTADWKERSIEEAVQERVIRGPIIGFSEKLKTNINLLRSIIQTQDLCVESKQIGTHTKTDISILYVKGIAQEEIIEEVRTKINQINVKYLIESRLIEEYLEGRGKSIFPLVMTNERPDSTVAALLEGRIAIFVNGTPHAILVPALFNQFLQVTDEYYGKTARLTGRFLRFLSFILAVYIPGIYISIVHFHKGIIPDQIVKKLMGEEQVLIPVFWQIIILLVLLQFIMDGSFRLPRSAVIAVSLIGSIFVGEAAVNAKLVHTPSIIFMGLTYISSFLILARGFESAVFALRFIFLLLGQFFGFMGLIVGTTIMIIYATSLRSVGVPYLAPLIPFQLKEMKDILYRGNTKTLINSDHSYPYDRNKNK
ncbi:TPA: spore germination protein [Bacillus cereus]|nr:spore germination protein [Bacillus cereus]HEI9581589.1 spore germination protein [Bacillus cereus]